MPYSGIQPLIQTIRVYGALDEKELYKQTIPVLFTSFVSLYCLLLITDGYYFIIFLALGVGLGVYIAYNKQTEYNFSKYERTLSYNEQTLEQVTFYAFFFFLVILTKKL